MAPACCQFQQGGRAQQADAAIGEEAANLPAALGRSGGQSDQMLFFGIVRRDQSE